jgi:hypothetical protein
MINSFFYFLVVDMCWQESQSVESLTMKKLIDRVEDDAIDGKKISSFDNFDQELDVKIELFIGVIKI